MKQKGSELLSKLAEKSKSRTSGGGGEAADGEVGSISNAVSMEDAAYDDDDDEDEDDDDWGWRSKGL